ncbi:MAG: PAS domain S-box protein [Alphaproteobacteria bacterium]|nr:PAS domain S-box protein [Rhodospirillales bacterium]MCW9045107.1 PAS domain S-box protein [Alphaproteobacteria bacterium]
MIKIQDRLSFKQAKIAVAIAFILGFLFSIVQISYDFLNEKKKVEGTVAQVMGALKAPAAIAAHNLDEILADKVIDSLLEYRPVYSATLYSDFEHILASKNRPILDPDSRQLGDFMLDKDHIYSLPLYTEKPKKLIGRMDIKIDGQVSAESFFDRSILTLALGFARNLILVFILTIFFYLTLTKPLAALAATIAQADPENPNKNHIPLDPLHEDDELGLVTRALQKYMGEMKNHIREQQKAEQALKESEQRFKDVAEAASDWVWEMDIDLKMTYVSDRLEAVTKISRDRFIGKTLLETGLMSTPVETWYENGKIIKARDAFRNIEYDLLTEDGEVLHWSFSGIPVFDTEGNFSGYRGTGRDITEKKHFELAQREVEERFRATFEQAAVGIAHLSADGSLLRVNQKLCEYIGYSKDELTQKNVVDMAHEEDWQNNRQQVMGVLNGKTEAVSFENRYLRADGEVLWANITLNPVTGGGEAAQYYVAVIEDITERKKEEEERRYLEEQLHQSQKMETIGRLAGGIAHDFNNILTPVLGYAEIILKKLPEDSPLREKVNKIATASSRASGLVKQILTFSRQGESEDQVIKLAPLIDEVLNLIRASFPANIYIHTHLDENAPSIMMDQTQAHQLVMNLCTNGAQAMGHAGGVLEVHLDKFQATPGADGFPAEGKAGTYSRLIVTDTGVGMEEDEQERIFEPFFTTKEVGKGTGLGLSMVHGIVTRRGGYITVESKINKGSKFSLYMPSVEDINVAKASPVKGYEGGEEYILFVDDEADNVSMAEEMLSILGYAVEGYTDPLKALEAFKASPEKFDLLISDQTMPFLTGDLLAKEVMSLKPGMPVLIITGYSETLTPEESKKIGIREYLNKPLSMDDLDEAIRKVFAE